MENRITIKCFISFICVLLCAGTFTSCEKNEEDDFNVNSLLLGTWKFTFDNSPDNWYTYTFYSNNTGMFDRPSWKEKCRISFEILYYDGEARKGIMTLVYENESKAYTWDFQFVGSSILIINGNKFVKV